MWLPNRGWQRIDPSVWATAPASRTEASEAGGSAKPIISWLHWLQWQWWGLDLAWSRWWLGAVVLGAVAGLLALALAWLQ